MDGAHKPPLASYVVCAIGFFGLFVTRWLTNQYVFPSYVSAFAAGALPSHALKDIAVGASAILLAAVAVASMWRQSWFAGPRLPYLSLGCLVAGAAATIAAQLGAPLPIYIVAAILVDVGCSVTCVMVCVGAMTFGTRGACVCVAIATVVAFTVRPVLMGFDTLVGFLVFVLVGIGTAGLSVASSAHTMEDVRGQDSPAELAVTHPTSFLPFGHKLYVSLFAFEVAYGFAITVGSFIESSSWSPFVLGALVLVAVLLVAPIPGIKADWLLILCILCVLAGILSFSVPGQTAQVLGKDAFSAGSNLFQALAFFALVSIGSRNKLGGLTVAAWGSAAMYLGVIVGANMGRLAEGWFLDAGTVSAATSVAALVYVAVMLVILYGFSIQSTISSVEDVHVSVGVASDKPDLDEICARLADERGLTGREAEVLVLLAKGRNSPYIQEALGVSYNTARTHVRHIYEKCDFHTQQELIDEIERRSKS